MTTSIQTQMYSKQLGSLVLKISVAKSVQEKSWTTSGLVTTEFQVPLVEASIGYIESFYQSCQQGEWYTFKAVFSSDRAAFNIYVWVCIQRDFVLFSIEFTTTQQKLKLLQLSYSSDYNCLLWYAKCRLITQCMDGMVIHIPSFLPTPKMVGAVKQICANFAWWPWTLAVHDSQNCSCDTQKFLCITVCTRADQTKTHGRSNAKWWL